MTPWRTWEAVCWHAERGLTVIQAFYTTCASTPATTAFCVPNHPTKHCRP